MALHIAVDFDGNDWVGYQRATDAPNLFGPASVEISTLRRTWGGSGGLLVAGAAFPRYGPERARFGKDRLVWTTGTDAGAVAVIGWNGTYDITNVSAGQYTAVIWAKLASGSTATFFRLQMEPTAGTTGLSADTQLTSSGWTRFVATGTANAGADIRIVFARRSGVANLNIELAGAMVVGGTVAPDAFNCGDASLLEDVTDLCTGAEWACGFVRPYQQVPPINKLMVHLLNTDKRFSPEYSGGALYGELVPGRLAQVGDPDHGIWGTFWTESWSATPGIYGEKSATLVAVDSRKFLDGLHYTGAIFTRGLGAGSTWHSIMIGEIMEQADVTRVHYLGGNFPVALFGIPADPSHQAATPPYYGDSNPEGTDAITLLQDILRSCMGHLIFSRDGQYYAYSGSARTSGSGAPNNAINDSWLTGTLKYEAEKIINHVDVTVKPKRATSGTGRVLWELDEEITLAPGETETLRVNFRNLSDGNQGDRIIVGGTDLSLSGWTLVSGNVPSHVTVTITQTGAQSCEITLTNVSGGNRTVTGGSVLGRKIFSLRTYIKSDEDAASIAAYGKRAERIESEWIATRYYAKRLAQWYLKRFKDLQYVVRSCELLYSANPSLVYNCYVGSRATITDGQTDHNKTYTVIGEQHRVTDGLTKHVVRLYFQPEYTSTILYDYVP